MVALIHVSVFFLLGAQYLVTAIPLPGPIRQDHRPAAGSGPDQPSATSSNRFEPYTNPQLEPQSRQASLARLNPYLISDIASSSRYNPNAFVPVPVPGTGNPANPTPLSQIALGHLQVGQNPSQYSSSNLLHDQVRAPRLPFTSSVRLAAGADVFIKGQQLDYRMKAEDDERKGLMCPEDRCTRALFTRKGALAHIYVVHKKQYLPGVGSAELGLPTSFLDCQVATLSKKPCPEIAKNEHELMQHITRTPDHFQLPGEADLLQGWTRRT